MKTAERLFTSKVSKKCVYSGLDDDGSATSVCKKAALELTFYFPIHDIGAVVRSSDRHPVLRIM